MSAMSATTTAGAPHRARIRPRSNLAATSSRYLSPIRRPGAVALHAPSKREATLPGLPRVRTRTSTASSSLHSSPVLREKKQQQRFVFFARNPGKNRVSSSSSQSASFGILTAAAAAARGGRGGEQRKNGNEAEEASIKRKSLVASSAAMMITTTTMSTTAFAAEEAVSSLAEGGTNGTLESVRLVVALSSIALILFQGPKGDGVVNTLSEKRVFSSAKNAKSAVDYVTYALIGGFIVLSAVLAVG